MANSPIEILILIILISFAAITFMIFKYRQFLRSPLDLIIILIFAAAAFDPTALWRIFVGESFKIFFSFIGGVSIGAIIWMLWILLSFCFIIYKPGTLAQLIKKNPLHPLFLLYSFISILYAPDLGEGVQAFSRHLTIYSLLFIFYFYLESETEYRSQLIYNCYSWIAFFIVVFGPIITLLGFSGSMQDPIRGYRYSGLFFTPNGYVAVCAFFIIYYLSRNWYVERKRRYLILIIFFIINGLLPRSVAGSISIMVALSTWLLLSRVKLSAKIFYIFIAFALLLFITLGPVSGVLTFSKGNVSMRAAIENVLRDPLHWNYYIFSSGRDRIWRVVWEKAFVGHEYIGSGAGASSYYLIESGVGQAEVVHNEYVRLLSEYGIFGTLLYIGAIIVWIARVFRNSGTFLKMIIIPMFGYLLVDMIADNILDYIQVFWIYLVSMLAINLRHEEAALEETIHYDEPDEYELSSGHEFSK